MKTKSTNSGYLSPDTDHSIEKWVAAACKKPPSCTGHVYEERVQRALTALEELAPGEEFSLSPEEELFLSGRIGDVELHLITKNRIAALRTSLVEKG